MKNFLESIDAYDYQFIQTKLFFEVLKRVFEFKTLDFVAFFKIFPSNRLFIAIKKCLKWKSGTEKRVIRESCIDCLKVLSSKFNEVFSTKEIWELCFDGVVGGLDETEENTRRNSCTIINEMMDGSKGIFLDNVTCGVLFWELLKLLNDSSNFIRMVGFELLVKMFLFTKENCGFLEETFEKKAEDDYDKKKCWEKEKKFSFLDCYRFTLDVFFVHLDDENKSIQENSEKSLKILFSLDIPGRIEILRKIFFEEFEINKKFVHFKGTLEWIK